MAKLTHRLRPTFGAMAVLLLTPACSGSPTDLPAPLPGVDASYEDSLAPCQPLTCPQLDAVCGSAPDGCGGKVECGTCTAGQHCGGGGPNRCGASACAPRTCTQLGASCGYVSDGCSNALDCGQCPAPLACGGGGVANQCGCRPKTCAQLGATCGTLPNGCGESLDCGTCPQGENCGGKGPNQCGSGICTAKSCAQLGATCGLVSDGCSQTLDCGTCPGSETCGGQGEPNHCACLPKTCGQLEASCGLASSGCGTSVGCGSCPEGYSCGGAGLPNQCGPAGDGGVAVCGDKIQTPPEICDDGFTDACGSCNEDCTGPGTGSACGDGVVCPERESCDTGPATGCGVCNETCDAAGPPCAGCASGQTAQSFAAGMVGCSGKVTYADRSSLCGAGSRVCSVSQWLANHGSSVPTYHYWVDDGPLYTWGTDQDCATANQPLGYGECDSSTPMRVCAADHLDPVGNACNWTNCGWLTATPNEYLGGCNGNLTAGSLCCPL